MLTVENAKIETERRGHPLTGIRSQMVRLQWTLTSRHWLKVGRGR